MISPRGFLDLFPFSTCTFRLIQSAAYSSFEQHRTPQAWCTTTWSLYSLYACRLPWMGSWQRLVPQPGQHFHLERLGRRSSHTHQRCETESAVYLGADMFARMFRVRHKRAQKANRSSTSIAVPSRGIIVQIMVIFSDQFISSPLLEIQDF